MHNAVLMQVCDGGEQLTCIVEYVTAAHARTYTLRTCACARERAPTLNGVCCTYGMSTYTIEPAR
jgi:hypothetical protein